ncbi:OmpA family protein [Candidatus Liberibacter solanacearum]|uniref:Flagellar motor protein MotB n=1 Tax=Candidatus Liberibacter solanacearum TaxID=556287 RepID=A0A1V2N9J5_9HYPH|nr:OmpA family protein [Candidatus Liberibacter solanacearum]ONI58967.1 flagellar motor protein MotB [Candidatus Liberibacter solanacearum]ONI60345.1 flagellar motor protein MotB [Candidatus Liberibacter solanacearum]
MIKRTGALMVIITALSGCSNQGKHQLFSKKLNNENNIIRIKPNFGSHLDKAEDELRMQLQDVDVSIIRKYDQITCHIPVHIAFSSGSILHKDIVPVLNSIATTLNKFSSTEIAITGHTDSIGTLEYNLLISQKRSQIITDHLIEKGVSPHRFAPPQGFAYKRPIDTNDTQEGRKNNQRVEINIFPFKNRK